MYDESSKPFQLRSNFEPWGYLSLHLGYIHVLILVILNVFFSESAWPNFTRFHNLPSVERVLSIYSNGYESLNKMAAMTMYAKNHLKIFSCRTKNVSRLNLSM